MKNHFFAAILLSFLICPDSTASPMDEGVGLLSQPEDRPILRKSPRVTFSPSSEFDESDGKRRKKTVVKKITLGQQAFQVGKDLLALTARIVFKIIRVQVPGVAPCIAVFDDVDGIPSDRALKAQLLTTEPNPVEVRQWKLWPKIKGGLQYLRSFVWNSPKKS